eukprot:scaffold6858_cov67-Phaeocystis_antarctica.AAC.2
MVGVQRYPKVVLVAIIRPSAAPDGTQDAGPPRRLRIRPSAACIRLASAFATCVALAHREGRGLVARKRDAAA